MAKKTVKLRTAKQPLSTGDTVELKVTIGVKVRDGDVWLGYGASTTVRSDETAESARARLAREVTRALDTTASDLELDNLFGRG